jgi:hypothetical protein
MALAERYFRTQAVGQAEGTLDATQRDLACFLQVNVTLISKRVKAGMAAARTWGKRVGRPATRFRRPEEARSAVRSWSTS